MVELPGEAFRLLVESVQDYAIYLLADFHSPPQQFNAGSERCDRPSYDLTERLSH